MKKPDTEKVFMKITGYVPYESLNDIPREWIEKIIAEEMQAYSDEQNKALRELLERVIKSSHPIWENRNTDLVNEIIKAKQLLKGSEDEIEQELKTTL